MTRAPAFQFYASDYLADINVQLMTLEEEGAYIRLLAYCWRENGLPNDDASLARLCKGASQAAIASVKKRFEQDPQDPERLIHKRLDEEFRKQQDYRNSKSEAGKRGAEGRWNRDKEPTETANPSESHKCSDSTAMISPLASDSSSVFNLQSSSSSSFASSELSLMSNDINSCSTEMVEPDTPFRLDGEPKTKKSPARLGKEQEEWFSHFWSAYPRRVGKEAARKAFVKVVKGNADFERILRALEKQKPAMLQKEPQFRAHPSTWLNEHRWEDEDEQELAPDSHDDGGVARLIERLKEEGKVN